MESFILGTDAVVKVRVGNYILSRGKVGGVVAQRHVGVIGFIVDVDQFSVSCDGD